MSTGLRVLPWSAYGFCGNSTPAILPQTVRVGLYEEFPNPWRLDKLKLVDFPVTVAIAASSRSEFLALRTNVLQKYPPVHDVYYWPVLSPDEGYYPGTWSAAQAVQRAAADVEGLPVLWDLETPRDLRGLSPASWWSNRTFLDGWFRQRNAPVYLWRTYPTMGFDSGFLRLIGMNFDPTDYQSLSLQLDLYSTNRGLSGDLVGLIVRCGVERYGSRFMPAFGVLNDGEGPASLYISPESLRRNLRLARAAGVSEVWLFGVNGLNAEYITAIRESLPMEYSPH